MAAMEDWSWLTPAEFLRFAESISLNLDCSKCPTKFPEIYIDTVTDEGFIPRSSTYGVNPETGGINMGQSRHLPCVRTVCRICGHVDLYSMYSVQAWKSGKPYGQP